MRHRVSYIHEATKKNPIKHVNATYVELDPGFRVAREDKYTLVAEPLSHIESLRIHISRPQVSHLGRTKTYENSDVFGYNYQTGVHIYAVPHGDESTFYAQLNKLLETLLGITVPREKWVLSLNSFYFHASGALEPRVAEIAGFGGLARGWDAFEYYFSGSELTVSTLETDSRALSVDAGKSEDYTEVGVFQILPQSARDDLILSGARIVMNDGEHADPETDPRHVHKTLFHIKPRHRHLAEKTTFELRENGLHPVVVIGNVPEVPQDDDVSNCKLFSYLTLEKSIFLDPYQVPSELTVLANYGVQNLELPEYAVDRWGNEVLMEVAENVTAPIELTLHSRYQRPNTTRSYTFVPLDKPMMFYACDVTSDAFVLENSPFDTRKSIGGSYEKFFTEDTVFYHCSERGTTQVSIPNASGSALRVNLVTFGALIIGLYMVMSKVVKKWGELHPRVAAEKKKE